MRSLRGRLLLLLGASLVAVWLAVAGGSYYAATREVGELFDAQLAQSARVLLALVRHELTEEETHDPGDIQLDDIAPGHLYESRIAFRVWDRRGQVLLQTDHALQLPDRGAAPGFSDYRGDGDRWRIYTLHDEREQVTIEVAQGYAIRDELIGDISLHLTLPMLVLFPLLATLTWLAIRRGLAPMDRVAGEVANRSPSNLQAVATEGIPSEIHPLVEGLNRLLARLDVALNNERHFTAYAAHELRTPLAAIRAQAQVASRAEDPAQRQQALRQIIAAIDRTTHMVSQLLILARLDPESSIQNYTLIDLGELLEETANELSGAARDKAIDLQVASEPAGVILGQREALRILLRNLLQNALLYTPESGRITASVKPASGSTVLEVGDSGPGVPEAELAKIFRRFYRGTATHATGSGLGLAIVRRVAELHQGEISCHSPGAAGGLVVQIRFPARPAA